MVNALKSLKETDGKHNEDILLHVEENWKLIVKDHQVSKALIELYFFGRLIYMFTAH